ncbi:hypothetical protein EON64_07860 [archaeon]|nr:MAG: hypothetical protein EON64_07860 [archaeon]
MTETDREAIQSMAVKVFTKHSPQDPAPLMEVYSLSLDLGRTFKACILTGRAVQDSPSYMCRTCRHYMLEYEIENFSKHAFKFHSNPHDKRSGPSGLQHCPLCHTPILSAALKK